MKLIAYVDESGLPTRCSAFVVAAVWKIVPPSVSYYQLGAAALLRAARELGMERARELKYTAARRRGWEVVGKIVRDIAREFRVDYEALHAEGSSDRLRALAAVARKLADGARSARVCVFVIDEAPLDLGTLRRTLKSLMGGCELDVKMKSSRKVAGLQLADLVAGFVREQCLKGLKPEL